MKRRSLETYAFAFLLLSALGCSATGNADSNRGGRADRDASAGEGDPGEEGEDIFKPGDEPGDGVTDGGQAFNDAQPDVGEGSCTQDEPPPVGPYGRKCRPPTDNECDGLYEPDDPKWQNGIYGNGLDDDCDGIVDEGCTCGTPEHPVGTTKECWLVPPSQMNPSTGKAVGWCENNALGTVRCVSQGSGEFAKKVWDGECRGAQLPFADDVCAPGDFDCDGVSMNSQKDDCTCRDADVICPSDPIVLSPYPPLDNIPAINGGDWIVGGPSGTSDWTWTVTGGDCDNILPHPTFAVYSGPSATVPGARISSDGPQTGLGPAGNQRGFVVGPPKNVGPKIHPAFALSGDYLVKGEWKLGSKKYECTVKVQVRAPGIRTELCWEHAPPVIPFIPSDTHDLDLHFARLQGNDTCANNGNGWFYSCNDGQASDDCFWNNCADSGGSTSAWGYTRSPDAACKGWGSRRDFLAQCDNPRLDLDNITCNALIADPLNRGVGDQMGYCAPENINLDNPKDGDRFAVGVHYYSKGDGKAPQPHVNIYCNGERKLAFGFDPTASPPIEYPIFGTPGNSGGAGDFWEVATIQAIVDGSGTLTDCIIEPIPSKNPKGDKDGSNNVCVDTHPKNATSGDGKTWLFTDSGGYPATAAEMCWH